MMYRQIIVHESHRYLQHIFYRSSPQDILKEYTLNTVTYGLTPSAFLAIRTLMQLVKDEGAQHPLASTAIMQHSYVDNIITGADSINQAIELVNDLTSLLHKGGFSLRKWSSNSPAILSHLPVDHIETRIDFENSESSIKVLGITWLPTEDCFTYVVQPFTAIVTKRHILSFIARFFDPLGLLAPIIFWAKYFIQLLWKNSLDWDTPINGELLQLWQSFANQLSSLSTFRIPRFIGTRIDVFSIIGFADASEKGYASAIYLHCNNGDNIRMQLIKSKLRVAPTHIVTIPKLELSAALLLAQLYSSIIDCLSHLNIAHTRFYTDSTVVLAWLKIPPHRLQTFVGNRVSQILEQTSLSHWHHVSSENNPADLASRGTTASVLAAASLWWQGPTFLHIPFEQFPVTTAPSESSIPELRANTLHVFINTTSQESSWSSRFSSYIKMLRVTAFIVRFINNCKNPAFKLSSSCLQTDELKASELLCLRLSQQTHFEKELVLLRKNQSLSSPLNHLTPFIDEEGIIRVGGRLKHANIPAHSKHPVLIAKHLNTAVLICRYFHEKLLHTGPRTTLSVIRQQFWIVSGRSVIRKCINSCIRCIRYRAATVNPLMGNLPEHRIRASPAFSHTATDFAGPFHIKCNQLRKTRILKCYLCLFICTVTKAVHLECVSDLSTPAFIAALHRFISRRGIPSDIYSDNGTQYVGASNQISSLYTSLKNNYSQINDFLVSNRISWHFNPPASPHFGGLFEAAIKSAKLLIDRHLNHHSLTFEEYSTLFTRIEAILNSRPLFEISEDVADTATMLTPGHFLIGRPLLQYIEPSVCTTSISNSQRWTLLNQLTANIWKSWHLNYLNTTVQRKKWLAPTSVNVSIGQFVILKGGSDFPSHWPLGIIVKLYPGNDQITRVVDIRTSQGIFRRPLNRLIFIPSLIANSPQ